MPVWFRDALRRAEDPGRRAIGFYQQGINPLSTRKIAVQQRGWLVSNLLFPSSLLVATSDLQRDRQAGRRDKIMKKTKIPRNGQSTTTGRVTERVTERAACVPHLTLLREHLLHLLRARQVIPDARAFDRRRSLQLQPGFPLRPPEVVVRRVPRPEVNYRYLGAPRFYRQRTIFPQDSDCLDLGGWVEAWKRTTKQITYANADGLGLLLDAYVCVYVERTRHLGGLFYLGFG